MNELVKIVETSGLEVVEQKSIVEKFGDYESVAREWEEKAHRIVVTSGSQITEMAMAREARKKFSQLRIDVERTRKSMKEQSLRKGQAIDAIAKFLVSLILPIEEYLKEQEDFVQIQASKEAEIARIEAERKLEEERLAKEEADRKEQERVRLENEQLKKEAEKREKVLVEERAKALKEREKSEKLARLEKEKADRVLFEQKAKADVEREAIETKFRKERDEADRLVRLEKEKADKILAEEKAKTELQRVEAERVKKLLSEQIECPFCHRQFSKKGKE